MGTLKWYKRDPRAALVGMHGLTLEERGAYNTILDLIYCRDGHLVDDPVEIAKWMSVDQRTWKAIRLRLINKGKIYPQNGCLHNERAANEIPDALERVLIRRRSAIDRWAVYRKIKGLQTKYAMTTTKKDKEGSFNAKVLPIAKRPSEVSKEELEEQFERKRSAVPPKDISRET